MDKEEKERGRTKRRKRNIVQGWKRERQERENKGKRTRRRKR